MSAAATRVAAALALLATTAALPAHADTSRWGSPDDPTVQSMLAVEKIWAAAACIGPKPPLADAIADDYQGTSTEGVRYGRNGAISADPSLHATNCQLGEVKIRFFGDSVAVAYGEENRMQPDATGQVAKRCQVWTDTWLKRNGKWQIVAAQDTVVACK